MNITITSKNNEQTFTDINVINIGSAANCNYQLNLPFELVVSLQKQEDGNWRLINTSKSDKILFKGQTIGGGIDISSFCKLMIDGSDEFISIKVVQSDSNEIADQSSMESAKAGKSVKSMKSIGSEDLNEEDIEVLYGKGVGVKTKIKLEMIKSDIEKRRALIMKEVSYKINDLKSKIFQNEIILGVLNLLIFIIPLAIAYILKDVRKLESLEGQFQTRLLFLIAIALIITTVLLKQSQFLTLQTKRKENVSLSTLRIKTICSLVSIGTFLVLIVFSILELIFHNLNFPIIIPQMILFCSFLCIFLGIFSGFTKNIIDESGEELDGYESREDFQSVVKDYQQWIGLFVNNITKKKLKNISNKIFNLQLLCVAEYILGIITAPFLAYGVSQTLTEGFPEAAGAIRFSSGFTVSPVFLSLATFMIIFAFHCFAVSFATNKRVFASNVIKQDGFSDYNIHGVVIHGVESTRNLKKEAKKMLLIALGVVFTEITMNMTYFIGIMENDITGILKAVLCALIPTALLIMETNMVANTKFEIKAREELMEKVDKDY